MPMLNIEPFRIDIDTKVIEDLRARLRRARFPEPFGTEPWALGTDPDYLGEFIDYWAHRYDWRATEARLNQLAQFTTEIDGQRIHFVHERRTGAKLIVLLSGWPSTFAEFEKIVAPLKARGYDLLAPSLPGFGFSGPTSQTGWTPRRIAGALAQLITALEYDSYGVHGGDWGAMVASQLALAEPDRCRGLHLSMIIAPKPAGFDMAQLDDGERADLDRMYAAGRAEMGYQQIQGTRPQSLSAALIDSPLGLAAWVIEKFRAWADTGGEIESRFTKDELCTNLTIYWATRTIASANRIYAETRRAGAGASLPQQRVHVPTAYARFPADGFKPPRAWVEALYDLAQWSDIGEGGHFPAYEVPALLVDDIDRFFADRLAA